MKWIKGASGGLFPTTDGRFSRFSGILPRQLLLFGKGQGLLQPEDEDGEGRDSQHQGLGQPMHFHKLAFQRPVGKTASPEFRRIGAEHLGIYPMNRHADAVIFPPDRVEIAQDDKLVSLIVHPAENDDALGIIIVGNPGKTLPGKINLPQGLFSR